MNSPKPLPAARLSALALLLPLLVACKAKPPPPNEHDSESTATKPNQPAQTIAVATIEMQLPASWEVVADHEPEFALIRAPGDEPAVCTIETRRQAAGERPLPFSKRPTRVGRDDSDYQRGTLRGRVETFAGPYEGSSVVVHCMAPHARGWAAIEAGFESIRSGRTPPSAAANLANDGPIVELCTGSPARRTYVCVRDRDGAVYCGPSETDALARVPELEPSVQIGCDGMRACSRAASGAVSCWTAAGPPPTVLAEVGSARDLAGGCIVEEHGKVMCRQRTPSGTTTETFAELLPLGDAAHALTDIDHVLAGSIEDHGCVLAQGQLRCWDRENALHVPLPDDNQPHAVETRPDARELGRVGGRVCVAGASQWTCIDDDQRFVLDDCQQRSCGCSLVGAMRLACEQDPFTRPSTQPFGRIADVVAVDGSCAALRDGTIVCRGSVPGQAEDQPDLAARVVGGAPGVLHALRLEPVGG